MSFKTPYQELIYKRTYSRWIPKEKRRETWEETVSRYKDFFIERVPQEKHIEYLKAIDAVKRLEIMPSMRALWTAGPALAKENIAGFNCSAIAIDHQYAFSELLYILMNGTGVGFSVERQFVTQLPTVPETFEKIDKVIVVADSKLGWAEAFKTLIRGLYKGVIHEIDYSKIRAKGERLKTFGGRASGPQSLKDLFEFTINLFQNAKGRKLQSIECHDLCCKVAQIVVVGGVEV